MVRTAFAFGIGAFAAQIMFVFVGILFFIGGYVMLNREQKKEKAEQAGWRKAVGFALMGIGVAVAGGIGFWAMLGEVGEELL